MKKRGRILRDASSGTGLISSHGQQYEFRLEGIWKSDVPPMANKLVDFEVDDAGLLTAAYAVSEGQLAKEQADQMVGALRRKGLDTYSDWANRLGKPVLLAMAALAASWFFLNVATVQITQSMSKGITFWTMLGIVNAPNGFSALERLGAHEGAGLYGFLAVLALAGPLLAQIWRDPRAHLGGVAPLLLMVLVAVTLYLEITSGISAASDAGSVFGGAGAAKLAQSMMDEMMKTALSAIHLGLGAYLSLAASAYLALVGLTRFLAAKA